MGPPVAVIEGGGGAGQGLGGGVCEGLFPGEDEAQGIEAQHVVQDQEGILRLPIQDEPAVLLGPNAGKGLAAGDEKGIGPVLRQGQLNRQAGELGVPLPQGPLTKGQIFRGQGLIFRLRGRGRRGLVPLGPGQEGQAKQQERQQDHTQLFHIKTPFGQIPYRFGSYLCRVIIHERIRQMYTCCRRRR